MRRFACPVVVFLVLLAFGTSADARKLQPPGVTPLATPFDQGVELEGAVAPVGATEVELRFAQYNGTLEVLECAKSGPVQGGQTLLVLSPEWIDKEVEDAKIALDLAKTNFEIAAVAHAAVVDELKLKLEAAERSLRLAKESLERFETVERQLRINESNQSLQYSIDRIADQKEELAQLEKMYGEDDLTEETEEIVLKRARRALKRSEQSLAFRKIRQGWLFEETLPRDHEKRKTEVRKRTIEFDKLTKTLALEQRKKDIEHRKADVARKRLEKKLADLTVDRGLLTVRAPVSGGVAVPAAFREGKWERLGSGPYGYEPGDRVKARTVLFTVLDPRRLRVRATVSQADRPDVAVGAAVLMTCTAAPGAILPGEVDWIAPFAGTRDKDGDRYELWVRLASGHPALRPGQKVRVGVPTPTAPTRLVLPAGCVRKTGDGSVVTVLGRSEGPTTQPVKVIERLAGCVAITGLDENAHVQWHRKKKASKKKAKAKAKGVAKKGAEAKKGDPESIKDDEARDADDADGEDTDEAKGR